MAFKSTSPYAQTVRTWYSIKIHLAQMKRDAVRHKAVVTDVVALTTVFTSWTVHHFCKSGLIFTLILPPSRWKWAAAMRIPHCHSKWCSSHRHLKFTLTVICASHCQLSQITLFHSFVPCVTCHGNKCVCMGSEDATINSFALGPAFLCQHIECDPGETAAASWPPESLLVQWWWIHLSWR